MEYNLISIEISNNLCSVSIKKQSKIFYKELLNTVYTTKNILQIINNIIIESELSYNDIDYILYGDYPNNLINIKLIISIIECLSLIWKIPIIKLSSLLTISLEAFLKYKKKNNIVFVESKNNDLHGCVSCFYENKIKSIYYNKINLINLKKIDIFTDSIFIFNYENYKNEYKVLKIKKKIIPKALYAIILFEKFFFKKNIIKNRKMKSLYFLKENYMKYVY